ncbi:hypothetical protein MCOR34_006504 [Pyricularia oryzae]|nr:hypothetical protein MCOR34_006504 [Pyricularia oryzae]KAI6456312.1 hypothetical protein MCOR17_008304 [Pyricularia oryzae]KAI6607053.1 hypothetical protein MCOR04_000665 [Pyricularia oryzae]
MASRLFGQGLSSGDPGVHPKGWMMETPLGTAAARTVVLDRSPFGMEQTLQGSKGSTGLPPSLWGNDSPNH